MEELQNQAKAVFDEYLSLFSHNANFFKFYMASNASLEWFGRSVRGPMRIHEFLVSEVALNYEHVGFISGQICDPIEKGSKHIATMKVPTEKLGDCIHPRNKPQDLSNLKKHADSDMDMDMEHNADEKTKSDVSPSHCDVYKTPERKPTSTYVPSAIKRRFVYESHRLTNSDSDSDMDSDRDNDNGDERIDDYSEEAISCKRFKLKHSEKKPLHTYLKYHPSKRAAAIEHSNESAHSSFAASRSTNEEDTYSDLQYVEATGILRLKDNHHKDDIQERSAATDDEWERRVRIRVSYRRSFKDQQILFALIIYEHAGETLNNDLKKSSTRRKLFLDFDSSDYDNEMQKLDEDSRFEDADVTKSIFSSLESVPNSHNNDSTTNLNALNSSVADNSAVTDVIVATVANPTNDEVAAALESAEFSVTESVRTPTKVILIPPGTPKHKARHSLRYSSAIKEGSLAPLKISSAKLPTPKRNVTRSLRL